MRDPIGGKAAGLRRLDALGVRVPRWAVLPSSAWEAHRDRAGLGPLLAGAHRELADLCPDRPGLGERARALGATLSAAVLAAELPDDLLDAIELPGEGPWAVRSSMVGEDGGTTSFAGQLDSLLFQELGQLPAAIRAVWASAVGPRALAYGARHRLDLRALQVGVVIQEMVEGQVSGVLFTADPQSGRRDRCRISATWGLGEGLVSGACAADEYLLGARGEELSVELAHKELRLVRAEGGGTREEQVPAAQQAARTLSEAELRALWLLGRSVAEGQAPQDLEWTLRDGQVYLLQARPITALPGPDNARDALVVWDNSNIQESYSGVTTPLTFSFASRGYHQTYRQALGVLGVPTRRLRALDPVLRNLIGVVNGRVYYNINNWYRGLGVLPSFGRNKEDMERMIGLTEPVDFIEDEQLSASQRLARLPAVLRTGLALQGRFLRLHRDVPAFLSHFEAVYRAADRRKMPAETYAELMGKSAMIWEAMLENWTTPIVNDFRVMMANGAVRRLLARAGYADPNAVHQALMSGEEGIASLEPTRGLMRLARAANDEPALRALLAERGAAECLLAIRSRFPSWQGQLDLWLERFGDRMMGELKLETPSLRDDPTFVIEVVQGYLDHEGLPDAGDRAARARRDALEAEALSRLGPLSRRWLRRALRQAREAVKARENMRLVRTRIFGLYRDLFAALGHRLHEAGRLDHPRDVFWLTMDELEQYHDGRAASADLAPIARARAREWEGYRALAGGHRVLTRGAVYHGNALAPAGGQAVAPDGELRGIGCYPGVVEAEARVVRAPEERLVLRGRVLVTERTDPGWAPLFPTVAGLLVERGSALSHSAVIARELRIPTVVGIPGLTARVRDGARVRLDGESGAVQVIDEVSP
ncbi:MAG: phosphoenolpyruvate synthase [Deltaproteobacteria bacterium]|nr:phosphoenolpyruvate synthase [Deltaproteobacteria bacterium]